LKKLTIAIDGYSSCGKSTLAKQLAKILNYRYVDTGAMYRAVTLYFLKNQIDFHQPELVKNALKNIHIHFNINNNTQETYLNNENIENEIRINPRVAGNVSDVSTLSDVRRFLVKQQQQMGINGGIVMDGRDIGTVVFPCADIKLFVTAKPEVRAKRRLDELTEKGSVTTFNEVLNNISKRDHIDTSREDSPLKMADDAILLDNSLLTREEQLQFAINLVNTKLNQTA